MRISKLFCICALIFFSSFTHAQDSLLGSYKGKWTFPYPAEARDLTNYATLQILKIDAGQISGTFTIMRYTCQGEYTVLGKYVGNKLEMITSQGAVSDCGKSPLVLTVQGNKLVGKYNNYDIEMSR
jgi:hypothetical protein